MPKLIEKYSAEVSQTQSIVVLIKNEDALKTPSVGKAIVKLGDVGKVLRNHLTKMTTTKGPIWGFFHQLVSGKADEEALKSIMKDMGNAKMDLSIYIQLSNVGLTRGVGEAVSSIHSRQYFLFCCLKGVSLPCSFPHIQVASSGTKFTDLEIL